MTWNIGFWKGHLHPLTRVVVGCLSHHQKMWRHTYSHQRKEKVKFFSSSALKSVLNCMLLCLQFHQAKMVKRMVVMGKRTHLMERRTERKRRVGRASAGRVIAAKRDAGQVCKFTQSHCQKYMCINRFLIKVTTVTF